MGNIINKQAQEKTPLLSNNNEPVFELCNVCKECCETIRLMCDVDLYKLYMLALCDKCKII